ncbi:MAG: sulfur carrier protein ThiS [Deltaproteobacteria bacterium]|nr:sulfur carrier protein ThiS [Deltaproteobacteria bacterium]
MSRSSTQESIVRVTINGKPFESTGPTTLETVLHESGYVQRTGVAAAVNEEVIPQARWKEKALESGDKILIITASQGG